MVLNKNTINLGFFDRPRQTIKIKFVMSNSPQTAIYQVLRLIPAGKVVTYGEVAKLAGLGRAARFVGTTLRKLPKDSQLPWHRVVNSQGRISLPDHHPSRKKQQDLLAEEGIVFINGRIDLQKFMWTP